MLNSAAKEGRWEDKDLYLVKEVGGAKSRDPNGFKDIIGQSGGMQEVFSLVEKVSRSDSTILIKGETGTGKGLIARAIHENSERKDKALVTINCGAIPENLLESELFGHVRGAFTGATSSKSGKFELANNGTVFLDEIGDMSADLQVKILRVLEEREFEQVGGLKTVKVDVRIIAATHRNLEKLVEEGAFREDLFYRLDVIPMDLPPLRERKSDIPLLVSHFMMEFNRKNKRDVNGVTDDAMRNIEEYSWPGNVRELKNMIERLVVLKGEGSITPQDLPSKLGRTDRCAIPSPVQISEDGINLNTAVTEFEKALILESLQKTNWVKNRAAKLLHLNRTTLVEKIKRHRLQPF